MTIEAIILWIGATVSLTLQYVSWENCHSSLQWVGWLNSETLRIIIEQSDWVTVRRHCNTFWHFMINFQVFGKSCLDALLIRNKIKIAVILCFSLYSKNENKQQTKHSDFRFKIPRYHLARFKVTKFSHWNKYFRILLQIKGQKFLYMERIYYMGNPNQKPLQRKFQNSSSRQYHSRDVKGPTRARLI